MMSAADWKYQECCNPHDTLHVHHIRYFKGRLPWEYEDQWLQVLCETCHALKHPNKARRVSVGGNSGIFLRDADVHYITLHEDLYWICGKCPCSAMILDYLMREHVRLSRKVSDRGVEKTEWSLVQVVSVAFLRDVLVWSYSKNSISSAIQKLRDLGFVRVLRKRPKWKSHDRRHHLVVDEIAVQAALDLNGGAQ